MLEILLIAESINKFNNYLCCYKLSWQRSRTLCRLDIFVYWRMQYSYPVLLCQRQAHCMSIRRIQKRMVDGRLQDTRRCDRHIYIHTQTTTCPRRTDRRDLPPRVQVTRSSSLYILIVMSRSTAYLYECTSGYPPSSPTDAGHRERQ